MLNPVFANLAFHAFHNMFQFIFLEVSHRGLSTHCPLSQSCAFPTSIHFLGPKDLSSQVPPFRGTRLLVWGISLPPLLEILLHGLSSSCYLLKYAIVCSYLCTRFLRYPLRGWETMYSCFYAHPRNSVNVENTKTGGFFGKWGLRCQRGWDCSQAISER